MVPWGETDIHVQQMKEGCPHTAGELFLSFRDNIVWYSVESEDRVEELFHCFQSFGRGISHHAFENISITVNMVVLP